MVIVLVIMYRMDHIEKGLEGVEMFSGKSNC